MYNTFDKWLKAVMKNEHISGQMIADKVGVSQKSISRYSTGEVEPDDATKSKIYEALAELTRNMDYIKGNSYTLPKKKEKVDVSVLESDEQALGQEGEEEFILHKKWAAATENAVLAFAGLSESNQKYILDNLEIFLSVDLYETYLIDDFLELSDKARQQLLEDLQRPLLLFKNLQGAPEKTKKIANYLHMVQEAEKIIPGKTEELQAGVENEWTKAFRSRLEERIINTTGNEEDGMAVEVLSDCILEYLNYTPELWYFLMLVQMHLLNDKEKIQILYYEKYGSIGKMELVGAKALSLISYLHRLTGKEE